MKKLNYLAGLLVIVAFSFGCAPDVKNQQDKFQVVKINLSENTSVNLSDFVENPEIIKLEKNDSCLISDIYRVELTTEYLFVQDRTKLYQFDKKGNYIRSIGRIGHGPHEFTIITCFTCSEKDKRIYMGTLRKILCFDFNGNFIEEIKYEFMPDRLEADNNQLWAFYTKYDRLGDRKFENRYLVIRYSLQGGILQDTVQLKSIKMNNQIAVLANNMQYLSQAFNKNYLYCPILIREPIIRDTLYRIEGNQLKPALKVDFSDFAESTEKGKNILIKNINRNEKYLFVEYSYLSESRLFLYDFTNDHQYNLTEGFNDNIFRTGNVMLRPLNRRMNKMCFFKDGYELVGKVEGVTENSNPVVFIVDLKK